MSDATPIKEGLRLNLGCGNKKLEGFVNVDKFEQCEPDLVQDLEEFPWPWQENAVSEILLNHVLEHLGRTPDIFLLIMKEIFRVCRPDAVVRINVPLRRRRCAEPCLEHRAIHRPQPDHNSILNHPYVKS